MGELSGRLVVPGRSHVGATFSASNDAGGDVLVAKDLTLANYGQVLRSRAVICEALEKTSHIAVVCRILGVPVLVLNNATNIIREGIRVGFDAHRGVIVQGSAAPRVLESRSPILPAETIEVLRSRRYQLSIIDQPGLIERVNELGLNNVEQYFLREELIWAGLSQHPFEALKAKGGEYITEVLVKAISPLAKSLNPTQSLNFRSLDFRSDREHDFGNSPDTEGNPQLGLHGIRQLLRNREFLVAELMAVDELYASGVTNVIYSLPFLTLEEELVDVLNMRDQWCNHQVKIGVFIETPAAVSELPHLLTHDVSQISVGTKDLAQFILAADRDNPAVADILDPRRRPVVEAIRVTLARCSDAELPVFVFAFVDDVQPLCLALPQLDRVSMPLSDYLRIFEPG